MASPGNPYFGLHDDFELIDNGADLAPFFDADQDGIYDPLRGDYPVEPKSSSIPGKISWSVFNTLSGPQMITFPPPVPLEISRTVWSFDCSEEALLNSAVFVRHQLINRS